jgi:hypothetical protein
VLLAGATSTREESASAGSETAASPQSSAGATAPPSGADAHSAPSGAEDSQAPSVLGASQARRTWALARELRATGGGLTTVAAGGVTTAGATVTRDPTTQALHNVGPQPLGVKLEVLTAPPPAPGAPASASQLFAVPAPPKGDTVYQREGFKELQAQWNPLWKEAHQLRSLDDSKQLDAFLRLHAGHVGAVGVTHNEAALMATMTLEVQTQLFATPSFVEALEGQPRGRPAAIFRWLLAHLRTLNDREDSGDLPTLGYTQPVLAHL